MYLFTFVELINKLLGIIVISTLSRILGTDDFVQYTTIMVFFGYLLELSFFSYQKKNIVDLNGGNEGFVYTGLFYQRTWVIIITSLIALAIFLSSSGQWHFDILPLSIILFLPIITLDYYLYACNLSQYIIASRFISQLSVCCLLLCFYYFNINKIYIFYINFLQSTLLTAFVLFFSIRFGGFKTTRWVRGFISGRISLSRLLNEFKAQKSVFFTKVLVLIIVSYEVVLLAFINDAESNEMVLGNRLAMIILPFLHFFLDSNVDKINHKNYLNYMIYNTIGVLVITFFSPLIILIIYGENYISSGFFLNYYLIFILFQAYVNYIFYISIKNNESAFFAKVLSFTLVISATLTILLVKMGALNKTALFCLVLFKILLTICLSRSIPKNKRIWTCILFLIPVSFNHFLIEINYFYIFFDYCNYALKHFNNYFR